jgi:hypothetical protein
MIIAQTVPSGTALDPNSASVSNDLPSVGNVDLDLSGIQKGDLGRFTDVFVNGQLLTSGSLSQIGQLNQADYNLNVVSTDSRISFAFGLERDDIVTVITKA